MATFLDLLSETSVTYIPDVTKYGWHYIPGSQIDGFEAQSPFGEIKCFNTFKEANAWRVAQILDYMEGHYNG